MKSENLDNLLRLTGWLEFTAEALRSICIGTAVSVVVLMAAIALDAVVGLDHLGLIAVDAMLATVCVVGIVYVSMAVIRRRYDARRVACLLERRANVEKSQLINAVEFSRSPPTNTSAELVDLVVRRGGRLASSLSPRGVVDYRPMKRGFVIAAVAMLAVVIGYVADPDVFAAVLPRLMQPGAGHPPFTRLAFDVRIEPEPTHFGRPASIAVTITGPNVPDHADIVFVDIAGVTAQMPMLKSANGRFLLRLQDVGESRAFFVRTSRGRSRQHELRISPSPLFDQLLVRYEYPEYTGWPAAQQKLEPTGIRTIEGGHVALTARSNLPLRKGIVELAVAGEAPRITRSILTPRSDDPATVQGAFTMQATGEYRIALVGVDGAPGREIREGPLIAVSDKPPQITITEPGMHVIAPEHWPVSVQIRVGDDVGISRIVLHRSVNGWGPTSTDLKLVANSPARAEASYTFDLAALGARGGDVITYYATAFDNYPGSNSPHFSDTPTYVIQVVSREDYEEFARSEYRVGQINAEYQDLLAQLDNLGTQRQDLLEFLHALQDVLDRDDELTDAQRRQLQSLVEQLEDYEATLADLADQMGRRAQQPPLYEFERQYAGLLAEMSGQLLAELSAVSAAVQGIRLLTEWGDDIKQARDAVRRAIDRFGEARSPIEQPPRSLKQTREDLQRLALADAMLEQGDGLIAIIAQQRDLADRLGAFRHKSRFDLSDQLRGARLAEQQDQLRRNLEDTAAQLERLSHQAVEHLPTMSTGAAQVVGLVRQMKVEVDQADAAQWAGMGQGGPAYRAADRAADKLESLRLKCGAMGGQGEADLDGCFVLSQQGLGRQFQQMAQARGGVQGLGHLPGKGTQGGTRSGFAGSRARFDMVGPHAAAALAGDGALPYASRGGQGHHHVGQIDERRSLPVERLDPGIQSTGAGIDVTMPGVPVRFHDLAEAYFQRIAEDSRKSER